MYSVKIHFSIPFSDYLFFKSCPMENASPKNSPHSIVSIGCGSIEEVLYLFDIQHPFFVQHSFLCFDIQNFTDELGM